MCAVSASACFQGRRDVLRVIQMEEYVPMADTIVEVISMWYVCVFLCP